jgi:hypothetical protein
MFIARDLIRALPAADPHILLPLTLHHTFTIANMSKGRVCLAYSGMFYLHCPMARTARSMLSTARFAYSIRSINGTIHVKQTNTDLTHRRPRYLDNSKMADRYVKSHHPVRHELILVQRKDMRSCASSPMLARKSPGTRSRRRRSRSAR